MRNRKVYGESKIEGCPFCGRQAIIKNAQDVPVCMDHKNNNIPELKCVCGEYLLMQKGKFGIFFNCFKCGNINMTKALEINEGRINTEKKQELAKNPVLKKKFEQRNEIVRSDDPRYF